MIKKVHYLPCTSNCAKWLRYGAQPKEARSGMVPGACPNKAHDAGHLCCGGRWVLVSRKWAGKTLTKHRADRADMVRQVLALAGFEVDDHHRVWATILIGEGLAEVRMRIARPDCVEVPSHRAEICSMIGQALLWRRQHDEAKRRAGPVLDHSSANRSARRAGR